MKLNSKTNLLKQYENIKGYKQIDSKSLYINNNYFDNNIIDIISYSTKIGEYNKKNNTLYITKNKYSITTTKQQNIIINNFVKFNNSKIEYTNKF